MIIEQATPSLETYLRRMKLQCCFPFEVTEVVIKGQREQIRPMNLPAEQKEAYAQARAIGLTIAGHCCEAAGCPHQLKALKDIQQQASAPAVDLSAAPAAAEPTPPAAVDPKKPHILKRLFPTVAKIVTKATPVLLACVFLGAAANAQMVVYPQQGGVQIGNTIAGPFAINCTGAGVTCTEDVFPVSPMPRLNISVPGAAGGTPGAPNTSVQWNNAGAFGGSANFTWIDGTSTLTVTGQIYSSLLAAGSTAVVPVPTDDGTNDFFGPGYIHTTEAIAETWAPAVDAGEGHTARYASLKCNPTVNLATSGCFGDVVINYVAATNNKNIQTLEGQQFIVDDNGTGTRSVVLGVEANVFSSAASSTVFGGGLFYAHLTGACTLCFAARFETDYSAGAPASKYGLLVNSSAGADGTHALSINANLVEKAYITDGGAGVFTAGITANVTGNVTGNASTASALDHDPAACAGSRFVTDVNAAIVLNCAQVNFTDLAGTLGAAQFPALTGDVTTPGGSLATTLATKYKTLSCQPGLGDGLNAMAAGTYLQTNCYNAFGATFTINSIKCFTDNNGTSTLNATNGAGTGLLTAAVTCTNAYASGTQSGTVTIASGDFIKLTFVADGTSKQTSWVITGTI
jgi:hypothetical protein